MRQLILLFSLFSCISFATCQAQSYDMAVGARVGSGHGINIKAFMGPTLAVEGVLLYRKGGLRSILMLEQHFALGRRSNTALYIGGGAHYGFNGILHSERFNKMVAGVDMVFGLEYTFPHNPVVFGVELKPMVELLGEPTLSGNNGGLFLRLILD